MRPARWDSEEQLKNKLLARLTLKWSDLSPGLANNRPLEREEHHDHKVFQDKHTRDSIWYMHHPQYQFLNILEIMNEAWDGGGNQPRNTVQAFLFCWYKYFSLQDWMNAIPRRCSASVELQPIVILLQTIKSVYNSDYPRLMRTEACIKNQSTVTIIISCFTEL